jgi:glyoxylase-like metal-dependent hydrolase (beta-lactamase superfamily II)
MKRLHRRDLFCWSVFNERLDIDFNSYVWTRGDGNVVIDPLPMSAHDRAHLDKLGGVAWIVLTNSDHLRAAAELKAAHPAAKLAGPAAEREKFPIACDAWLSEREPLFVDWRVYELDGSKTPGELALLVAGNTLVTGDLVRANRPASLMMLNPAQGLKDAAAARESISRLAVLPHLEAVLVGDGWPLFADCHEALRALVE